MKRCGTSNNPCGSIKEAIESERYKREGLLCGNEVVLSLQQITMKEIDGDPINVPLIAWKGGNIVMSGITIIRMGGGGGSDVVISVCESSGSEMSECVITYHWKDSSIKESRMKNEDEESICEWTESVIVLKNNSKFGMSRCELNGTRNGGISVNAGDLNMSECIFDGTAEEKEGFESVHHNVICSDQATITMNTYNGWKITKNTSLWIMIGECTFRTEQDQPASLLYVPILKGVRYDNESGILTFYGSLMIGCNMSYEIFYSDGKAFTRKPVSLSEGESERETVVSVVLATALSKEMNAAHLVYGENRVTEEKRILWPGEEYEEQSSEEGEESGNGEGEGGGGGREVEGGRGGRGRGGVIGIVIVIIIVVVGVGVGVGVWVKKKKEGRKRRGENNREMNMSTGLIEWREEREEEEEGGGGEREGEEMKSKMRGSVTESTMSMSGGKGSV